MPDVKITIDSHGYILIPIVIGKTFRDWYEVPPVHTKADADYWLFHLKEKIWFTPDLEAEFKNAVLTRLHHDIH